MAKRSGNGEASITRRKDRRRSAQYAAYSAAGGKRKTVYGKTRQNVAAKLAKALSDREGALCSMQAVRPLASTYIAGPATP